MNRKFKSVVECILSVAVVMMVFAKDCDNVVRFVIPATISSLLVLLILLISSDFYASCGDYIISKRSYYKKKKKEPAVVAVTGCFTTEAELSKLPPEYVVICNYNCQALKVDNLVIGPGGIYVIDSNCINGTIDKVLSVLMLNENLSMDGSIQSLKEKLNAVAERLKSHTPLIKALKPVLCFTTARVNLLASEHADGVLVVSLKNLLSNIAKAPVILDSSEIRNASSLLLSGAEYASCRSATT
jgi:Nuclease-related domain